MSALVLAASPAYGASTSSGLGQTRTEPSLSTGLRTTMAVLWQSMEHSNDAQADSVFFPEAAYVRMKTGMISNPVGDYQSRLLAFYHLDVAAYHALLASTGASTLVRVEASAADAAWINPGVCENSVGYWHLPGVRLVFQTTSGVASVAVASLISWRGVWYVVHLGPNPRPRNIGTVDSFARSAGRPGPPGGC